jgi:hypothetical protein
MCFSHMEENLWKALHCEATKTELAVLALYAQAISHPYMRAIRGNTNSQINMLELAPLHSKVQQHMEKIIQHPDLLVGATTSSETGCMDGQPWQAPGAMTAIQELVPKLPHLKELLIVFFKGALETWKRFTSEFAPGGLIDETTSEEKELAWMPPTNDVNEGALGSFRVLLRRQPQLSLLQFNAQTMYMRNDTEAFMKKKFQPEDHQYIRQLAHENDSRGTEKQKRMDMVEHAQAKVDKRLEATNKRKKKAQEKADRVASVKLIFDKEKVKELKGQSLKDHLEAFQKAGAPNLQNLTSRTTVAKIREELKQAIDLYKSGHWKPTRDSQSGMDSDESEAGEVFDLDGVEGEDDDEGDWENV